MADKTLTDVVNELRKQNANLTSVKDRLELDARERKQYTDQLAKEANDRKRKAQEKEREQKADKKPTSSGTFKGDIVSGIKDATGFSLIENLGNYIKPLVGGVIGALFGAGAISALRTFIGKSIGRGLIFGPAILILEHFGKDIMNNLLTQLRDVSPDWLKLSDGALRTVGDGLIDSLNTGLLFGIFFGKKGFVAGFLGNILSSSLKWLTGQPEGYWDKNFNFAGMEFPFTNDTVMLMGSTLAAYFGPSLMYGAVTKAFGGTALAYPGANVGRNAKGEFMKLKPSLATKFRGGFSSFLGAGAIALIVGQTLGSYISNEFGEDSTVAGISDWLITSGQLVYMSRALGFIRLGWVGVALYTAYALSQWISGKRDELVNDATKEANEALESLKNDDGTYKDPSKNLTEDQRKAFDFIRFGQKTENFMPGYGDAFGQEQLAAAAEEYGKALAFERTDEGLYTQNAIDAMLKKAILERDEKLFLRAAAEHLKLSGEEVTVKNIKSRADYLQSYITSQLGDKNIYSGVNEALRVPMQEIFAASKNFHNAAQELTDSKLLDILEYEGENTSKTNKILTETNSTFSKLINEFLTKDASATPPVVVNQTNAPTTVSNNSSMVTNNGPVIDISDSMIMRYGAPSAL